MPLVVSARPRRQNRSQPAAFTGSPAIHAGRILHHVPTDADAIANRIDVGRAEMSRDLKGNLSCTVAESRHRSAIFAARIGKPLVSGLFFLALAAHPAVAQPPPTFAGCQNDVQGANDVPGQKDLTRFCVAGGNGTFELFTQWNWDLVLTL